MNNLRRQDFIKEAVRKMSDFNRLKHIYNIDDTCRNHPIFGKTDSNIASLIYNDLGKMSIEEQKIFLGKIISPVETTSLLVQYEFNLIKPTKVTGEQLSNVANRLCNRYTWRAGGREFESPTDKNSPQEMLEGEFWLTNTVSGGKEDNVEHFMNRLVDILKQLNNDFKIEWTSQFFKRDDITMFIIRFFPKSVNSNDTKIISI